MSAGREALLLAALIAWAAVSSLGESADQTALLPSSGFE